MLARELPLFPPPTRLERIVRISMRCLAVALVLACSAVAGYSLTQGDPENPKKNPHPVKRYEVIATAVEWSLIMLNRTVITLFQGLALILGYSLLTACGSDDPTTEIYSPNGQYHAQIQICAGLGELTKNPGQTTVSILPSGKSEDCSDDINSIAQFRILKRVDKPDIEWVSNMELRAWDPEFEEFHRPYSYSYHEKSPIKIVFAPKKVSAIQVKTNTAHVPNGP